MRRLSLIFILLMLLALCSCGGKIDEVNTQGMVSTDYALVKCMGELYIYNPQTKGIEVIGAESSKKSSFLYDDRYVIYVHEKKDAYTNPPVIEVYNLSDNTTVKIDVKTKDNNPIERIEWISKNTIGVLNAANLYVNEYHVIDIINMQEINTAFGSSNYFTALDDLGKVLVYKGPKPEYLGLKPIDTIEINGEFVYKVEDENDSIGDRIVKVNDKTIAFIYNSNKTQKSYLYIAGVSSDLSSIQIENKYELPVEKNESIIDFSMNKERSQIIVNLLAAGKKTARLIKISSESKSLITNEDFDCENDCYFDNEGKIVYKNADGIIYEYNQKTQKFEPSNLETVPSYYNIIELEQSFKKYLNRESLELKVLFWFIRL